MVVPLDAGPAVTRSAGVRDALAAAVVDAARDLARLVVPVECAGCGRLDLPLCPACRALLGGPVTRCEDGAPRLDRVGRAPLPVWTLAAYTGPTRELVVAWKDRGRTDLTPALAATVASGAGDVAEVLRAAGLHAAPLLVVPAPSSDAARRRRGVDLVGVLAGAAARGLAGAGVPAVAAPALALRPGGRDQVGLTARARRANVRGRVRWRTWVAPPPRGACVLLVDDVLTTGATLAACDEAVRSVGACVVAALTLAATPAPGAAQDPLAWRVTEARATVAGEPGDGLRRVCAPCTARGSSPRPVREVMPS